MRKSKVSFREKMMVNQKDRKESRKSYGYLNVPAGIKTLSLEEGTPFIFVDFLPYEVTDQHHPDRNEEYDIAMPETLWHKRPFKVHRNVGANDESVVCPKSVGKPCPICDYRVKRIKEGADKEEYKLLYPKDRTLFIVVPLDLPKHEAIPHIWDMSDALLLKPLEEALAEVDNPPYADLNEGKTIKLYLRWKELGDNKYCEVRHAEPLDREPYDESILDEVPNLDEMFKILSYKEIENKFFELDSEEDAGDLKEVEHPAPVRHAPQRGSVSSAYNKPQHSEEAPPPRRRPAPEPEEPARATMHRDEPIETKAAPVRRSKAAAKPVQDESGPICPSGHRFGIDTDLFPEDCDACDIWNKCAEANTTVGEGS